MTRLMISLVVTAALVGDFAMLPTAAVAQAGQGTVDIFGNDPCPREAICIRHKEGDRYRLPQALNPQGTRQQRESWAQKSKVLTTVGDTGPQSCSNVGPGGFTGCVVQTVKQAKSQNRQQSEDNQPPE